MQTTLGVQSTYLHFQTKIVRLIGKGTKGHSERKTALVRYSHMHVWMHLLNICAFFLFFQLNSSFLWKDRERKLEEADNLRNGGKDHFPWKGQHGNFAIINNLNNWICPECFPSFFLLSLFEINIIFPLVTLKLLTPVPFCYVFCSLLWIFLLTCIPRWLNRMSSLSVIFCYL